MKNKIIVLFIIVSVFIVTNLVNAQDYAPDNYVPGNIIVGFYDNTTEDEAIALVESYGLSWEPLSPKLFSFWVKVLMGSPEDYIDDLEDSNIVSWADYRGNPQGEADVKYILVQFNIRAIYEAAHELIDFFDGLEVSSIIYAPIWGRINVPEGEEQKWIETFEKEGIVKYAELIGIERIPPVISTTEPIRLDTSTDQESEKSNYLYYTILIGAVLLLLILFFILRKKR